MDPDAIILGFSMLSFKPAFSLFHFHFWASLVVQLLKNLPTLWETWVWSLGWEDSLEEGKATHYPLQYSGLENFMDRGAWQATVHEVAKSRIWLSNFHFHQELGSFRVHFAFCHKGGVICISEIIDISPSNLDSSLCFIQPGISHDVILVKPYEKNYSIKSLISVICPGVPLCCPLFCAT